MQRSSSLNYFSQEGVTAIAKVSVTVLRRFRYKDSHTILCALLYDYVLDNCVCASARAIALAVVPHHVIRGNVRRSHQFPLKNESDNVSGNVLLLESVILNNEPDRRGEEREQHPYTNNMIFSFSQYHSLFNLVS